MEFIGRKTELALLEREYRRDRAFTVIYGRRRVGKTALIKQFLQQKHALYFLASRESEGLNRKRFAEGVAALTGQSYLASASFDDWRPLFEALASAAKDRKLVIVIDELPYLVKANPAFPSIVQYAWDEILSHENVMLILCGSSVSMMREKVLSYNSPLYGRRTSQLRLKPLPFSEIRASFPDIAYKQLVSLYAITGGVPKYLEFFDPAAADGLGDGAQSMVPFERGIVENVLSPSGFLYEEPYFLFEQEGRDPANYFSILSVIADGNRKSVEISRAAKMKETALPPYIKALQTLGYLEREVPFNEVAPEKSKNGLYRVADEFLAFWFRYVQPYMSDLEMGNVRPSLLAMSRTFESNVAPFLFERLSRQAFEALCAEDAVRFEPVRVGSYWTRSSTREIDVCAYDRTSGRLFVGECKYHRSRSFSTQEYASLIADSHSVPRKTDEPPLVGLFSATGFEDKLIDLAKDDKNLILIDCGMVVG